MTVIVAGAFAINAKSQSGSPPTLITAAPAKAAPAYPLSAFAAMGSSFAEGNHLPELGWNEAQIAAFIDGINAAFHGKSYPFDEVAGKASADMGRRIQEIVSHARGSQPVKSFPTARLEPVMKELRERLGLQKADSGLAYRVETGRGGPRPRLEDTVVFSCVATAVDGETPIPELSTKQTQQKMLDLLPGFREGLQMMTRESKAVFVLPPNLSFGDGDWPNGLQTGSPLICQITLFKIIPPDASH